jgi:NADPH-dependent curcumin reductase CurA
MPGLTAYFGLLDVGRPRPGETVAVSAASGAVGQLVGQIAKLASCRAVAIAGDEAKLGWCREIGFDAGINYKKAPDLTAAVKEACPKSMPSSTTQVALSTTRLIVSRASIRGFLVLDWWHRRDEALRRLAEWQLAGKIRFKEDVLEGIERMPEAFLRLLHGKNFGKQIVRIN